MGRLQPVGVGVIEEDLGLQDFGGRPGNGCIVAKREIKQHFDGWSALHVRQQLEGEIRGDFANRRLAGNDVLEKPSLDAGRRCRAGQRVVDEVMQGILAMGTALIHDLLDDGREQCAVIDRLRAQAFRFAFFDFLEIIGVKAHGTSCCRRRPKGAPCPSMKPTKHPLIAQVTGWTRFRVQIASACPLGTSARRR